MKRRDFIKLGIGGMTASLPLLGGAGCASREKTPAVEDSSATVSNTEYRSYVVDTHTHWLVATQFPEARKNKSIRFLSLNKAVVTDNGVSSVIYSDFIKLRKSIKKSERGGVTLRLLAATMQLQGIHKATGLPTIEVARRINDFYAQAQADYSGRVHGMATVSPFERSHLGELDRCLVDLDLKGVAVDSSYDGIFLDDPRTYPFWERVEDRGIGVFIHPPQVPIAADQMAVYRLEEAIGRPFDDCMCVARMIYSGLFDRFPKLKIHVAHMGGALLAVMGRLDFTYRLGYDGLPDKQAAKCRRRPSDYFTTNIWVDTMGFNPIYLKAVLEAFGPDRVMFGSDYGPVPISPREHVDMVKSLNLDPEIEQKIFWRNADAFYGLGLAGAA